MTDWRMAEECGDGCQHPAHAFGHPERMRHLVRFAPDSPAVTLDERIRTKTMTIYVLHMGGAPGTSALTVEVEAESLTDAIAKAEDDPDNGGRYVHTGTRKP